MRRSTDQICGLKLLSCEHFEAHKSIDQSFEQWMSGLGFDLTAIKEKLEFRRTSLLEDIDGKQ